MGWLISCEPEMVWKEATCSARRMVVVGIVNIVTWMSLVMQYRYCAAFGSYCYEQQIQNYIIKVYTELFISPSGISELDCATTKTDTAERSISIGRESLQFFFCIRGLGVLPGSTARG